MASKTRTTKPVEHSTRAHALLSASGASRWMNCTPSAKLEEQYGERRSTSFSVEGTLAHELAEAYLSRDVVKSISDTEFADILDKIMSNELYNDEMLDYVPIYTDYCAGQLAEAQTANNLAVMEIEQRLNLTEFVPESFGTADCVIINDDLMEVIDLKYGKGVAVYADWNVQLMLYGLGALQKYDTMYDINEVRLTIVQPRLNNISSWQISAADLRNWAENELRIKADMAFHGEGELNSGEWCKFCAVRNKCRKLYEDQMEVAKYDFADSNILSDEEISDIVKRTPKFVEWANGVSDYARAKALSGEKKWPGLKIVEGRSTRKWSDEQLALTEIKSRFKHLTDDEILNVKLKGIGDIEKLVGKKVFAEELSELVVKPQGTPCLVPDDDKRPAMGVIQAQIDFTNN